MIGYRWYLFCIMFPMYYDAYCMDQKNLGIIVTSNSYKMSFSLNSKNIKLLLKIMLETFFGKFQMK